MTSGSAFRWLAPRGVAGGPLLALLFFSTVAAGDSYEALGLLRPPRNTPAREFALPGPGGSTVRFGTFKGKVVFLNFWASWCPPCRAEARDLEAAWRRYKDQKVVFLGVDIQDREEDAREFLKEFGVTYPNGRDANGRIAIAYGVWGIPETFLIDGSGRITYKHVGAIDAALLPAKIAEAAAGVASAREGKGEYQPVR